MKVQLVVRASVLSAFLVAGVAANAVAAASKDTGASSAKPIAIMQSAYTHLVSGKPEKAIAEYAVAISLPEISINDKARALLNRALAHQKIDAHADAISDYSQAIELDALSARTRAVALYNRGLANSKLDNKSAAIDDYTNALYLDPYLSEAFYARANVLREAGQYDYALIDYARATKRGYPHKHLSLYGKALALAKLGHRDEAIAALFGAYAAKPDFAPARERLSDLGVKVPEKPDARQIMLAVLPSQSLMADSIVTGTVSTPSGTVKRLAQREPVAPPAHLLNTSKAAAPAIVTASASAAIPAPARTQQDATAASENVSVSVEQVAQVPALPVKVAEISVKQPQSDKQAGQVRIEPVAATADEPATDPAESADTEAETGPVEVAQKLEGWTVQLVSQRQPDKAWDNWEELKSRHGKLLRNKTAAVVRADVEGQGTYYRLRVHKLKKRQAKSLCRSLKRKGAGCFIARAAG